MKFFKGLINGSLLALGLWGILFLIIWGVIK
jgi:hypothetical protein